MENDLATTYQHPGHGDKDLRGCKGEYSIDQSPFYSLLSGTIAWQIGLPNIDKQGDLSLFTYTDTSYNVFNIIIFNN